MGSPGTNLLHTSQAFFDKYLKGSFLLTPWVASSYYASIRLFGTYFPMF